MDEVALEICLAGLLIAERRFGWDRQAVLKGLHEREHGVVPATQPINLGRRCSERVNPQLEIDIRMIVEQRTQADSELKSPRLYTNFSPGEVRKAQIDKGYSPKQVLAKRLLEISLMG